MPPAVPALKPLIVLEGSVRKSGENLRVTGLEFPGDGGLLRDVLLDWFRKKKVIE